MGWPIPTSGEAMVQLKGRVGSSRYRRRYRRSASKKYTKAQKVWMPYTCHLDTLSDYNAPYNLCGGHPVKNPSTLDITHPWLGQNKPFMPVNFFPQWATAEQSKAGIFDNAAQVLRVQGSLYVTLHTPSYYALTVNDAEARYQFHALRCPIDSMLLWQWRLLHSDSGAAEASAGYNELDASFQVVDDGTGSPATNLVRDNIGLASSKHILAHGVIPVHLERTIPSPLVVSGTSTGYLNALGQEASGWYMRPFRIPMVRIPKTGFKMDLATRLQLICQLKRADGTQSLKAAITDQSDPAFFTDNGDPNIYPIQSPGGGASGFSDELVPRLLVWPHMRFLMAR